MASLEEVLPVLETEAKAKFPNLDLQDGTVEKDVFLRAPALLVDSEDVIQEYARRTATPSAWRDLLDDTQFINDSLPRVFGVSTVDEAAALMSAQIDLFAGNYGVVRNGGSFGAGAVSLIFSSGGTQTVVAGSVVRTPGTPAIRFVTTQTFTGTPVLVGGVFKVVVPIRAAVVGTDSNVPAHNITVVEGGVTGLLAVDNESDIAGGADRETDKSVLDRVINEFQGNSVDTLEGVRNVVLDAGAFDAAVFRVGDPVTRNRPGPDVLAISEQADLVTDIFTFEATHLAGYVPTVQPLNTLNPAVLSIAGHPACQFLVVPDTSVNERSARAQDRVVFFGADVPVIGESVQFTYAANKQIAEFQDLFAAPNPQLFFDVLVKTAIRVDIAIGMNVVLFTGVDGSGVTPVIQSTLLSLVNNLKMGESLNQSDVIAAVEAIPGVNRVNLPLNFFGLAGASGRVVLNTIEADVTEYLRLMSANLTFTVV
jgi:uncharacterized phage protein gp47/JayE